MFFAVEISEVLGGPHIILNKEYLKNGTGAAWCMMSVVHSA
jgi:hypothetical protein